MSRQASGQHRSRPKSGGDRVARLLKWVGAVTAVLSLVFALREFTTWVRDARNHRREVAELLGTAQQQAKDSEYAPAWTTLEHASQSQQTPEIETAKQDVAMAWLEDARPGPGKPFATIVDTVVPTLEAALLHAQGARRADLLSHVGWAKFLQTRDGLTADPESSYREALAVDAGNPYANAMLGHSTLWRGGTPTAARPYFDAALASGRGRAFVRQLQVAALSKRGDEDDLELVRVVNAMRQGHEPVDADTNRYVRWIYARDADHGPMAPLGPPLSGVLPAADQLATFEWLLADPNAGTSDELIRAYVLALLQEAAGDRVQAIATLRALRPTGIQTDPNLAQRVDAAIARLSRSAKSP